MITPILYSQLSCPYSQRARLALAYAGIIYEHREVNQKSLPKDVEEFCNGKRVPLLILNQDKPLDHSLDIMHWALLRSDPDGWLDYEVDQLEEMQGLVTLTDSSFSQDVMKYVNWDGSSDRSREKYRKDCELFLEGLEERLVDTQFLYGDRVSMADFAIFPFVNMFNQVKLDWFRAALYPSVWRWLDYHVNSHLFESTSKDYILWHKGQASVEFHPS